MIVLDTNIVSALMKEQPDEAVLVWLDRYPRTLVWMTSITVLEVRFGIEVLAAGPRRDRLAQALDAFMSKVLSSRILTFARSDAEHTAALMALRRRMGRPVEYRDAMIAGIAKSRNAQLATGNIQHFEGIGLDLLNPWTSS